MSTETNLVGYQREHPAELYVSTSLCRHGRHDRAFGIQGGNLADGGGRSMFDNTLRTARADARGRYVYRLYLPLLSHERVRRPEEQERDGFRIVAHDMRRSAADLCVHFTFAAAMLVITATETVLVPYPVIAAALARAGLPHADPPRTTAP